MKMEICIAQYMDVMGEDTTLGDIQKPFYVRLLWFCSVFPI